MPSSSSTVVKTYDTPAITLAKKTASILRDNGEEKGHGKTATNSSSSSSSSSHTESCKVAKVRTWLKNKSSFLPKDSRKNAAAAEEGRRSSRDHLKGHTAPLRVHFATNPQVEGEEEEEEEKGDRASCDCMTKTGGTEDDDDDKSISSSHTSGIVTDYPLSPKLEPYCCCRHCSSPLPHAHEQVDLVTSANSSSSSCSTARKNNDTSSPRCQHHHSRLPGAPSRYACMETRRQPDATAPASSPQSMSSSSAQGRRRSMYSNPTPPPSVRFRINRNYSVPLFPTPPPVAKGEVRGQVGARKVSMSSSGQNPLLLPATAPHAQSERRSNRHDVNASYSSSQHLPGRVRGSSDSNRGDVERKKGHGVVTIRSHHHKSPEPPANVRISPHGRKEDALIVTWSPVK